jgi:hypothetical protein
VTLDELSKQLGQDNWTLSVKDAELAVHGKRRAFAPPMLAMLRHHKAALVGLIKRGQYAVLKNLEYHEPENVIPANCSRIMREEVDPSISGPCPAHPLDADLIRHVHLSQLQASLCSGSSHWLVRHMARGIEYSNGYIKPPPSRRRGGIRSHLAGDGAQ